MRIIDVTADNVEETGFFCLMSRRKSEGWQRKLKWLHQRFAEGLRIKMLDLAEGGRDHGLKVREVELTSAREIRELAPSPYGVFSIVVDGEVLSHYYQPRNRLDELLDEWIERKANHG